MRTHLELLEYAENAVKKDAENANALFDLSDVHQSIARTYARRNEFDKAFSHFQKSLAVKDELIAADPENADARRIKFVTRIFFGDAQLLQDDSVKAANTYRTAFEEYKKSVPEDDSYLSYAEGFMNFKLGNSLQRQAGKQTEKNAAQSWNAAAEHYSKALDFWKKPDSKEALYSDVYQEYLDSAEKQMNFSREQTAKN